MNQNGALGDLALRQALLRGLDKETYCSVLLEGGATPGKAPVPPTLDFGFDELTDENSYDPESAKEILAEAGYEDIDGDGYVETPDGEPLVLNFVIYTSRAELGVYAQAAQANLKEIGINVNLETVSYETLLDMRDSGQYDLLIWNVLVANTGDPENYLRENWYSSSPNNTAGYNNAEVDALLDELAETIDTDARKELIVQIQQLIMDDAATVFFGYETTYLFSNTRVTGVQMYPMDYYWLTKDIALTE
jgi:peptide/nickel transport system substrate-binding protein